MNVELSLISVIIVLFIIDRVVENLFNWWFREGGLEDTITIFVLAYLLRTVVLIYILVNIL